MKICLAGEGAQGLTHMQALRSIEGVEVVTLAGGIEADAAAFAKEWKIPHHSLHLEECLRQPGVEAVVLTTPNQLHTAQAALALNVGKHVLVELPMGLTLADSQRLADLEEKTGLVCMVCHTQRYSPPHREIYRRVRAGELHLHHIVAQTYFFRRQNVNRFGRSRTWTDDLLWHMACHIVDFVSYLLDDPGLEVWGQAGPDHPTLGIPMDLTLGMRSRQGCLVSAVLSFNNHGPIDASYRFIGEENTLFIQRERLTDHQGNVVPLEGSSVETQDREFFDAIREGRRPLTSCKACLPTMALLDRIQKSIEAKK
jgi:2-hydroxy-4-carboxymuconate semialdehyde hemiacetal dehydrogenase